MEGAPEFLIGTQSYTFDIKNEKDGKQAPESKLH